MAIYNITNRAYSTLASGVSDSDTSWTLATGEGARFPSSGNFPVTCEDEIVLCTARSGDVLTVTRAQEGTAAVAHSSGKAVELRITAGIFEWLRKQLWDDDGDTGIEVEQSADEDKIHFKTAGNECGLFSALGILTLAKQSSACAYPSADQIVPPGTLIRVFTNTELWDIQGELDTTNGSGTAEAGTSGTTLHDDGAFTSAAAGDVVWNTTDNTYTTISSVTSADEVECADAIFAVGETFKWYRCKFTATEAGKYLAGFGFRVTTAEVDKIYVGYIRKDGTVKARCQGHASVAGAIAQIAISILDLAAGETIDAAFWQGGTSNATLTGNMEPDNRLIIFKLA